MVVNRYVLRSQGCLGVVGITKRVDITEMFEKRVKSRFSHRIINLTGGRSFDDYVTMATKLMYLENVRVSFLSSSSRCFHLF